MFYLNKMSTGFETRYLCVLDKKIGKQRCKEMLYDVKGKKAAEFTFDRDPVTWENSNVKVMLSPSQDYPKYLREMFTKRLKQIKNEQPALTAPDQDMHSRHERHALRRHVDRDDRGDREYSLSTDYFYQSPIGYGYPYYDPGFYPSALWPTVLTTRI